jgi:hypothetical protein
MKGFSTRCDSVKCITTAIKRPATNNDPTATMLHIVIECTELILPTAQLWVRAWSPACCRPKQTCERSMQSVSRGISSATLITRGATLYGGDISVSLDQLGLGAKFMTRKRSPRPLQLPRPRRLDRPPLRGPWIHRSQLRNDFSGLYRFPLQLLSSLMSETYLKSDH